MNGALISSFPGGWAIAWLQERYEAAQWILVVNTVLQLYGMFFLKNGTLDTRKDPITVLVSKTCVAAALMFMWKTWGAIDVCVTPAVCDHCSNASHRNFHTLQ